MAPIPPNKKLTATQAAVLASQTSRYNKANRGGALARSIWDYLPEVSYPDIPEMDYQHFSDYTIPHLNQWAVEVYEGLPRYEDFPGIVRNFPYNEPVTRKTIPIQPQTKNKQVEQQVKKQKKDKQKKQAQQKQVRNYSSSSHPSIKYSFSGADCRAWGYFSSDIKQATIKPQTILIDSLGTISISIHESKSPVRRLGHMAPVGYTRAIRTIAGSMVLTIIGSEHPLKELSSVDPRSIVYYSQDANNSGNIVTKMSPFNLILLYQSELPGSKGAKLELKGVEFINEGIVTSVNDLVSEVVLQFVALDIVSFDEGNSYRPTIEGG